MRTTIMTAFLAIGVLFAPAVYSAAASPTPSPSPVMVVAQATKEKTKKQDKAASGKVKKQKQAAGKAAQNGKASAKTASGKKNVQKAPAPKETGPSKMPVYFALFAALLGTGAVFAAAYMTNPPPGTEAAPEKSGAPFGASESGSGLVDAA